jgi:hypothetical protein
MKPSYSGGKMENPGSFQGIFTTLSSIFQRLLLCRYHSKILLRSGLNRVEEKSIGYADVRLLT